MFWAVCCQLLHGALCMLALRNAGPQHELQALARTEGHLLFPVVLKLVSRELQAAGQLPSWLSVALVASCAAGRRESVSLAVPLQAAGSPALWVLACPAPSDEGGPFLRWLCHCPGLPDPCTWDIQSVPFLCPPLPSTPDVHPGEGARWAGCSRVLL